MVRFRCALAFLLVTLAPEAGWPLMIVTPIEGKYSPSSVSIECGRELAELGNLPGRVYGQSLFFSEIGDTETLYFAGGTAAFNVFLANYSKLRYKPLVLTRTSAPDGQRPTVVTKAGGSDCDGATIEEKRAAYDWQLIHYLPGSKGSEESVHILLFPGDVRWNGVKVPGNVAVRVEGREAGSADACASASGGALLAAVARDVKSLSSGTSQLLVAQGVSGKPGANRALAPVAPDGEGVDFIRVFPVSAPVRTTLPGVGLGKILGALRLGVRASRPGGKEHSAPGVYMLFYRTYGLFVGDEAGAPFISLLSADMDANGQVRYKEQLTSPLLGHDPEKGSVGAEVRVDFPEARVVTAAYPAWRVRVGMRWPEVVYRFCLDLDNSVE